MFNNAITEKHIEESTAKLLMEKALTVSVAESCTGGLVSSKLTDVSGSSAFIKLNLITYSNESKIKILGVPEETINMYGAVSKQTAYAMAKGVRKISQADIGLAVTGIAGPTGGTSEKPVGLVYIGISCREKTETYKIIANPQLDRKAIKNFAAEYALYYLKEFIAHFYK